MVWTWTKVLACDGTHIGVSMRYMDLQNPVTISDDTTNTILQPTEGKYN